MSALILLILKEVTPLILGEIEKYKAAHGGKTPTHAELEAIYAANIDKYLSEWDAWKAAHPTDPAPA